MKSEAQQLLSKLMWDGALKSAELRAALESLDTISQRIVYMRFWESLTIDEIAEQLRISWKIVDRKLSVALEQLRLMIETRANKPTANGAA